MSGKKFTGLFQFPDFINGSDIICFLHQIFAILMISAKTPAVVTLAPAPYPPEKGNDHLTSIGEFIEEILEHKNRPTDMQ